MRKIKIGISGSHSTGKTTFIKRLEELLNHNSIEFKTVTDLATICPLPILRKHTIESTLWIASKGVTKEIEAEYKFDVVIADRSILDCWAYFNAVCKNRYEEHHPKLKTLKSMISNWLPTYNILYQTVINEDFPIENNKGRDLNIEYRKKIGVEMIEASKQFGVKPKLLTTENTDTELELILTQIHNART